MSGTQAVVPEHLAAHVALRLAAVSRRSGFVGAASTEAKLEEALAPLHREGTVHALVEGGATGGVVRAVLAWRHDPEPWQGAPVSKVAIDYLPGSPDVSEWLSDCLDRELPRMTADLDLLLDVAYAEAYRALRARGLGVEAVVLLGEPRAALRRLREGTPRARLPADVTIAPLRVEHLDEVMALQRRTFRDAPEYCWFGANPSYLERHEKSLREDIQSPDHLQRVVLHRGAVAGHLASSVDHDNAFWGPTAGTGLLLAPALRGRGLLRALYEVLLEGAIERGAVTFKGGTSQPPVLALARRMGRPAHALSMRREAPFPEAHFAPYAPLPIEGPAPEPLPPRSRRPDE